MTSAQQCESKTCFRHELLCVLSRDGGMKNYLAWLAERVAVSGWWLCVGHTNKYMVGMKRQELLSRQAAVTAAWHGKLGGGSSSSSSSVSQTFCFGSCAAAAGSSGTSSLSSQALAVNAGRQASPDGNGFQETGWQAAVAWHGLPDRQ